MNGSKKKQWEQAQHSHGSFYLFTDFIYFFFFNKGKEKTNVKQTSNLTIEKVPEHCLEFFKWPDKGYEGLLFRLNI